VQGWSLGGLAPGAEWGAAIFGEVGYAGPTMLAPAFRISAIASESPRQRAGAGTARFSFFAGRAEGCPIRWAPASALDLAPCVSIDIGQFRAESFDLPHASTETRFWFAPGLFGHVRWSLTERLAIEMTGGAFMPATQKAIVIKNSDNTISTLHVTPKIAGAGAIGIAVRFP
jgi:hypothetical protein